MIDPLSPDLDALLARARSDLRLGLPVAFGGTLALAAECVAPSRLAAMADLGPLALAVTARRAATLRARVYDGDLARIRLRDGISAAGVARLADPKDDLTDPLSGPHETLRGGDATAARAALMLLKSARLLPAAVLVEADAPDGVQALPVDETLARLSAPVSQTEIVSGKVPLALARAGRVHVFRPGDGGQEHVAVEIGRPPRDRPVLVRMHSACFTGDVLGSLKCDCGPQLAAALARMGEEGQGVLLYLDQEGRGIGLANKLRAYALQDQGFDTVEANHRLGFDDDERDFRAGAEMLRRLGFSAARLMTNNPAKVARLEAEGIRVVERVPLAVGRSALNAAYLDAKAAKSGHLF